MKLVVGLGNPGRSYAGTRHNVGYEAVEAVAGKLGLISASAEYDRLARNKFEGLALDGTLPAESGEAEKLLLLKPVTFMNRSGQSVQAAMSFYQIAPQDTLIVLDDLALPVGAIRLRPNGSDGGHNGLRDIQRVLGTQEYPRLRIGIDPPPPNVAGKDYVLGRINEQQREQLSAAVSRAADAIIAWARKGIAAAMNVYNSKELQAE